MSTYTSEKTTLNTQINGIINQYLSDGEKQLAGVCQGLTACEIAKYADRLGQLSAVDYAYTQITQQLGSNIIKYAGKHHEAPHLSASLKAMAGSLAKLEFHSISAATEKTLKEMQFSTKLVSRGGRTALEASKGHSKLLVLVENKGAVLGTSIKTDWAGLADTSCLKLQEIFEQKLAKNGVSVSSLEPAKRHLDPRGGQLISSAGKIHASNLAEGLLRAEERSDKDGCQTLFKESDRREKRRKERL
ncbi:MAG: hypothetical protein CVU99_06680 [Firmicutes bacterium HGW-Firmicutes-4]|jgi:hypothetical protein|nr:MAG: hypothetical protein CVU99_06680 [Firmicutes bacterium HGW-Firmicutes-4]